ncbi:OLC1v1031865C1 [Oldenlandia corymbosa var. corymbosa]|uniref:OLC1v1031865C1 n=1 Tax=Oldenlandia corymbosa var. corymbosa TaxID=529605 RepID=A0AAV1CK94_OLDCO|nr:OLC1v1031865C1 [Oldenlandia corymbosa var. corymbosa]
MGLIKSCFQLMAGTIFGVYVAQNYDVPDLNKLYKGGVSMFKVYEENFRKPKKERGE